MRATPDHFAMHFVRWAELFVLHSLVGGTMQSLARVVVACTAAVVASPRGAIAEEHGHPAPPARDIAAQGGLEQALAGEVRIEDVLEIAASGNPEIREAQERVFGASARAAAAGRLPDRKSTRLNSSHMSISYAVFCLKKQTKHHNDHLSDFKINNYNQN